MLESGKKIINKIQLILTFAEAKFISKQAISDIRNLAMMFKG